MDRLTPPRTLYPGNQIIVASDRLALSIGPVGCELVWAIIIGLELRVSPATVAVGLGPKGDGSLILTLHTSPTCRYDTRYEKHDEVDGLYHYLLNTAILPLYQCDAYQIGDDPQLFHPATGRRA